MRGNPTHAVSFIGVDPYIQYNQNKQVVGGAEFEIIDTYAKTYGFMPKLRREPTYDMSSSDVGGETIIRGMVGSVGFYCLWINPYSFDYVNSSVIMGYPN